MDKGVVQSRFQIINLKHIEYILAAKMRCDTLYIGIIDPDDLYVAEGIGDQFTMDDDDLLTYLERYEMIHDALLEFGVRREEFEIVPFPLGRPDYLKRYVPAEAKYFMSISDESDEEIKRILMEMKLDIEVMWRRTEEKNITSREIRRRIVLGEEWEQLVPKSTYRYLIDHNIDNRIRARGLNPESGHADTKIEIISP